MPLALSKAHVDATGSQAGSWLDAQVVLDGPTLLLFNQQGRQLAALDATGDAQMIEPKRWRVPLVGGEAIVRKARDCNCG